MLAIAIDADHVVEAKLKGELVAGLHRSTKTEVMRHRKNVRAAGVRQIAGAVSRAIVDDKHGHARDDGVDLVDDSRDCAFLVIGGHDNQEASARRRGGVHWEATSLPVIR